MRLRVLIFTAMRRAFGEKLYCAQINVLESVILPVALLPLLFFNFNARIMGNEFVLGARMKAVFAVIGAAVILINVYLVSLFFVAWDAGASTTVSAVKWSLLALFMAAYVGFVGWLCVDFVKHNAWVVDKEEQGATTSGQVQLGQETQPLLPMQAGHVDTRVEL